MSEVSLWQNISHPAILKLQDVFVQNLTVHLLTEYCAGGHISSRPERAALRAIASVAAALQHFLSLGHSAHANLSSAHILLDARGAIKLGGFGYTRARRIAAKPNLSEKDDVRALTATLYELLVGRLFDPNNFVLPRHLSTSTATLIRNVLLVKQKFVPELTVFRYDLTAARGFVPECSKITSAAEDSTAEEDKKITATHSSTDDENAHLPSSQTVESAGHEDAGGAMDDFDTKTVLEIMGKLTNGDVVALSQEEIDIVVRACAKNDQLPDNIFKFLFTLHISKNPIVAYKTVTLLHYLLAEGPAKLTALAITHDGFLSWAEGAWVPERVHSKSRKADGYAQYFAEGEIVEYMGLLRKRVVIHAKFAQVLSTHWVPRVDGLTAVKSSRAEAVKGIVDIVQSSHALLNRLLKCVDPLATMKQAAVPVLVGDLAKAYLAICWLYATADEKTKPLLNKDFAVAHNTTHISMEAVRSNPGVSASCSSNLLLDLKEDVPVEVNLQVVTSALKKKKKKKKKKKALLSGVGPTETEGDRRISDFDDDDGYNNQPEEKLATNELGSRQVEHSDSGDEEPDETRNQRAVHTKSTTQASARAPYVPKYAMNGGTHENEVLGKPPLPNRSSALVNGLEKLSLNVRRSTIRREPISAPRTAPRTSGSGEFPPQMRLDSDPKVSEEVRTASKPLENIPRQKISTAKRFGSLKSHLAASDPDLPSRGYRGNGFTHASYHGVSKARTGIMPRPESERSASESESSEGLGSTVKHRRKGTKSRRQKSRRRRNDPESSEGEGFDKEENQTTRRRALKPKSHPDEKKIPFDKTLPKKRAVLKNPSASNEGDAEYRGGSKEALAAAASGKKTPSMNATFEVAPYEVQFGPQIGSGGFGVVFKAKFRGETVAVKKIHAHALSNINSITEFQSEVAVLCTLCHPHILRFVGACTKPPNLMIITEFMARGTLFDLLHQSQTRVTWPMRKKFALDTCKGMRYLHDSKLLHRDLKSSNLMLDKDFNCKVGDFGLTRISRGSAAVQMTGQCGTFQYMAVEVLANKPYSEKADVFSFGVLLWEMVARKLPYFGMQPMQVGIAVLQQGMRPPIPPKCPLPLAKLMQACWDNDPNRRPSFAQLVEALEAMPE